MNDLALIAIVLGGVSLLRTELSRWPVTGPMLYVGAGVLLGPSVVGAFDLHLEDESVVLAAELTLAFLLFSDAARIDTMRLRRSLGLPLRLLGVGLPLTILLGTLITAAVLTDLEWAEAGLLAAILAPTDAALGQAVVSNPHVPVRVRQALNVESGLNDGLVVPVVAVFAALAVGDQIDSTQRLVGDAALQILVGVAIGAAAGFVMAKAIPWASARTLTDSEGIRLVAFGGILAVFGVTGVAGGNGFIAAFVCGIALHQFAGEHACEYAELAEDAGQIGAAAAFVIFGALMVVPGLEQLSWPVALCALATLTVGRMVPVAIATLGTRLKMPTVFFLGWFGPRGLASLLFGLLVVAERGSDVDELFEIISIVILASVLLHGVTAAPGAAVYARWFAEQGHATMEEATMVPTVRTRGTRSATELDRSS